MIWEVKEFIRNEKASFKKQKLYPNEENKKDHKTWQMKCKNIIRQARGKKKKKKFEEQLAGAIKHNTKFFFHRNHQHHSEKSPKKPTRQSVEPTDRLNFQGIRLLQKSRVNTCILVAFQYLKGA